MNIWILTLVKLYGYKWGSSEGTFVIAFCLSLVDPLVISSLLASGCDGAPLLPLLYVVTNIAFNISLLNLVKISSAVVSSLATMLSGLSLSLSLIYTQTDRWVWIIIYVKSLSMGGFGLFAVPIAIYVLSLPLPYLPEGVTLSPFFLFGGVILLMGLLLYNIPQPLKQQEDCSEFDQ